ncbi:ATP-binding protein [Candidatus Parcubacteria bacterium]|nr:ATP-binding protein [Candidatus Parcubacteria bacterium]
MIERTIENHICNKLGKGRVIVLYGPRRVGKTTLTRKLLEQVSKSEQLYLNCDELATQEALKPTSLASLERVIGHAKRIVIDEAQRVVNIGLTLKILVDARPELDIIATGSSSFELADKVKEPLTGRSYEFHLSPLSVDEIKNHFDYSNLQMETLYERLLRYGSYPGIVLENDETAEEELKIIAERYVYKDTLELVELRQRQLLPSLLQQLALQIGQETSYHELGNLLGVKLETIERYITLLESAFIIHRLPALTGIKQGSLSNRKRKVYFYDLGIRNALIQSLQPLSMRADREALWENFCVNERLKQQQAAGNIPERYYWRGINGGKVDLVEKNNNNWQAYGFSWEEDKKSSVPKYFSQTYPDAKLEQIHHQNLLTWLE